MQICVDLGIADHDHHHHVWEEKQAATADAFDELGEHFKVYCMLVGCHTEVRPIRMGLLRQDQERACWCLMIAFLMLFFSMLTDPLWWMCQLSSFLQWKSTQLAILSLEIFSVIVKLIDVMRLIDIQLLKIGHL